MKIGNFFFVFFFILLSLACVLFTVSSQKVLASGHAVAQGPAIKLAAPPDRVWVREEKVFLSGVLTGINVSTVTVKGVRTGAKKGILSVDGGAFGTMLSLKKGVNTIEITAGPVKERIRVCYIPAGSNKRPPRGFRHFYVHAKQTPLIGCRECHRYRKGIFKFKRMIPAVSNCTSSSCHSNTQARQAHVHGPVGAGICISCHNPHGSFNRYQLERKGKELCLVCHQAKRAWYKEPVIHSPVKEDCIDCHDPHQSPKRFQLKGTGRSISSLCFNCHDKTIFTRKHQHGPVAAGDCVACHNPHASTNEKLLIAPMADGQLCFQCHSDRRESFNRKYVHDPVRDDCGNCHDPHSSNFRYQLLDSQPRLCKSCHEDLNPEVFKDIATARYEHPPAAKGECTACHEPHASNYRPLLANSMEKLCFSCHEDLGDHVMESRFRHGPVKTGDCTACHKPHGSQFVKLLVRYYPTQFYAAYSPDKYDLCFGCHNKNIAKTKYTTTLTNFRDGKFNLHYFHVHRKKGRTCTACHAPHASNQYKHIRSEVPFGGWSYPIVFTKRKTGGTCVVGCHAPKTYDRVHPRLNLPGG